MIIMFQGIIEVIESIVSWILNVWNQASTVFRGINFNILYNWLPTDIVIVISAVIATLLVLAIFRIVKSLLIFLG